ncbi:MAG: 4Fe-4S dicluster domain-containing protein [Candidatus Ratteibacteria bacterium]|jgi:pyruvate ferredoxin oxidoreductase delta subunit
MRIKITAEPGSARNNKTGSWRVERRPKFLQKNCIACRLCVLVCPEGIVSGKEKNDFKTDYLYCKGCGLCAAVCPKKDIEMVPEEMERKK